MEISGKVALVTGGSSGIGLAVVQELLKNNVKGVAIVDINPPNDELNNKNTIFIKTDVSDFEQLETAFKKTIETFKNLDFVFNNAGILYEGDWKKMFAINLLGATNCMVLAHKTYLPKYKSGTEAIIISTSSIVALDAFYAYPHYTASKFGVLGLVLSYGNEYYYNKTNIKVIAICPAVTDTRIFDNLEEKAELMNNRDEVFRLYKPQTSKDVALNVLEIIKEGVNGSVWTIVHGKKEEVDYPKILKSEW